MKKILLFIGTLFIFFFTSCKKEMPLEGDIETLVGKWNWVYSDKEEFVCEPPSYSSVVTPTSEGFNFEMEFDKEGFFNYSHTNDGKMNFYVKSYQVSDFLGNENSNYDFSFNLSVVNTKTEDILILGGGIGSDSLYLLDPLPFADQHFNEGSSICATYTNYFVRQ